MEHLRWNTLSKVSEIYTIKRQRLFCLFLVGFFKFCFILLHSLSLCGGSGAQRYWLLELFRLLWGVRIHPNPLHIIIHYNSNHLCCFAVHCPLQPGLVVVPNDQHREGGVPAVVYSRFTTLLPLPAEENINVKNSPCVVSSPFYVPRLETCQA